MIIEYEWVVLFQEVQIKFLDLELCNLINGPCQTPGSFIVFIMPWHLYCHNCYVMTPILSQLQSCSYVTAFYVFLKVLLFLLFFVCVSGYLFLKYFLFACFSLLSGCSSIQFIHLYLQENLLKEGYLQ